MLIFNNYKYDYTWPGIKAIIEDAECIDKDEKKKLIRNLFFPVAKGVPGTLIYIISLILIFIVFFFLPDRFFLPVFIPFSIIIIGISFYRSKKGNSKVVKFPLGIDEYVEKLNSQYKLNIIIDHKASH